MARSYYNCFFFLNDAPPTKIYTLPLHDALPIGEEGEALLRPQGPPLPEPPAAPDGHPALDQVVAGAPRVDHGVQEHQERSEEHTSELQSRQYLVCRLLLEKKKKSGLQPKSTSLT